ncbi:MAG: hypothetical protein K8S15_12700 [Candidatus Aegiribacteria sp.]|nr:hypothetical protein [Candidatus Aegiribacteria sp.]
MVGKNEFICNIREFGALAVVQPVLQNLKDDEILIKSPSQWIARKLISSVDTQELTDHTDIREVDLR